MQRLASSGRPRELASSSVRVKATARQGLLQGTRALCSPEWWLLVCPTELRAQVGPGFLEAARMLLELVQGSDPARRLWTSSFGVRASVSAGVTRRDSPGRPSG